MERGWGTVTLADNHNSDHIPVGFLFNKSSPRFDHHQQQLRRSSATMFPGLILNCGGGGGGGDREDHAGDDHEINNNHNRMVVNEVDFFSSTKSNDHRTDSSKVVVKKEHLHDESTVKTDLHLLTTNTGSSDQSSVDDGTSSIIQDKRSKNELAVLQVELERMNTENQRLRGMLNQVSNNYTTLQTHFVTLMQQQKNSATENNQEHDANVEGRSENIEGNQVGSIVVPRQFMDLSPSGATPVAPIGEPSHDSSSEERTQSGSAINISNGKRIGREETPDSEVWGPNKVPKLNIPKSVEQATEATMRKARVSVRARSEAPMISDGCQWRKYGQKMAKGNPCPRAYYRCTMAVGCPVRKQVQRCADDRAILITTYEGTHNHPLPPAAMAMASTTSAAATMLLSGSMASADGLMNPNFLARTILPNSSSIATISASAPFPTVTLDLTHTPNPFQRPTNPTQNAPGAPPPQFFGQGGLFNQSKFVGLHNPDQSNQLVAHHHGAPPQFHQPQPQTSFADTLTAATAAITADPNFTAALAAAITSMISGNNNNAPTTPTSGNNNPTSGSQTTSSFPGN